MFIEYITNDSFCIAVSMIIRNCRVIKRDFFLQKKSLNRFNCRLMSKIKLLITNIILKVTHKYVTL